jgi:hypothetical protein
MSDLLTCRQPEADNDCGGLKKMALLDEGADGGFVDTNHSQC